MHIHYDATELSESDFVSLLRSAHAVCRSWWMDKLDCEISCIRQSIEIDFEGALRKLDKGVAVRSVVHRRGDHLEAPYFEFGFTVLDSPSFYLWIIVDVGQAEKLIVGLKPRA